MNIKSLLLGSAAALVAVSGARAADAVMAPEPEPVEYVRVCDAYGAGFFYIPGTETCLQISGYVRYEIRATESNIASAGWVNEGWRKHIEARVNFDARNETEWGTLRSYIRFQASDYQAAGISPDLGVLLDQAYIQLAGFTIGYTESYFVDGFSPVGAYGTHSMNGGPGYNFGGSQTYGYQQRALIAYNFNSNGFFGAISLEDDSVGGSNYLPDVVLKAGYAGGWGGVYATLGVDEDNASEGGPGDTEVALRAGVQINVPNAPGSSLRVYGLYASGLNQYWDQAKWSIAGSYQHQFSPMFFAHVGAQYWNDLYLGGLSTSNDGWGVEAGVGVNLSANFQVRGEVTYTDWEGVNLDDGVIGGRMRFIRTF